MRELDSKRKKIFFIGALFLIAVGIYHLVWVAIPIIDESNRPTTELSPLEKAECGKGYRCNEFIYSAFFNSSDGKVKGLLSSQINFTTDKVYSVFNRINFTAEAIVFPENSVQNVYFVLVTKYHNATDLRNNVDDAIRRGLSEKSLINMTKQDEIKQNNNGQTYTSFKREGYYEIAFETPVNFFGIIKLSNMEYHALPLNIRPVFEVQSHLVQLQADTNIALLKEVRETESSNKLIEGLTWVGISLVFFWLGGEVMLRLLLDPYIDKSKNSKNEKWFMVF